MATSSIAGCDSASPSLELVTIDIVYIKEYDIV
jgi:hypothetical protein